MHGRQCGRHRWEGMPGRPERLSRLIEPVVLLVLKQHPGLHGYEIIRHVYDYGLIGGSPEPGAVYRVLRQLEQDGALRSQWVLAEAGAAKRTYVLTEEGDALLEDWVQVLRRWCQEIVQFIQVYDKIQEEKP